MKYELPPQAVLEGEIRGFNRRFAEIAQRGRGSSVFTFQPGESEQLDMVDTTTAAFWKHFIGGQTNAVAVMIYTAQQDPQRFPVDPERTRQVQWQCYSRTRIWQRHPLNRNTPLETESYKGFLEVCTSFDWSISPTDLMEELNETVQDIGDTYTMLEGKLPLRMIMHNLRQEGKI